MKRIAITALSATIIATGMSSLYAESQYYEPSKEMIAEKHQASSTMRMEYYNKYLNKGYDVSSLKSYLDGTTTTESEFWEALKKVQNNHEVAGRKAHVEKLKAKGYDVSSFTEEVIWDSGKFWGMAKMIESGTKPIMEGKKEMPAYVEGKKEEKKAEMTQKMEDKKAQMVAKISAQQAEKLKAAMKARIAKLPADTRDATLAKLESTLTKSIESARARNAKLLVARYEVLLSVVVEEMNTVDDETLVDSLFQ